MTRLRGGSPLGSETRAQPPSSRPPFRLWRHLLASAGALPILACGGAAPAPDWTALGRSMLAQLIGIDTTHAHGSTLAAQAMADRLITAGVPAADITLIAPPGKPAKGNLIVRLRAPAGSKTRPVLFMGHLDVVEADPRDWSTDPFRLTEQGGYLYGRGAIDMKGQDVAMLVGLMRLRAEQVVPERDIILMLTADEEAGGDDNGPDFLLRSHRGLIDAGLAFNPDTAGSAALMHGKRAYIALETSEKQYLTYTIRAVDKGGHSSEPTPANPIDHLAGAVARIDAHRFAIHLTNTTRRFFAARAALETAAVGADMAAAAAADPSPAALARLSAIPELDWHMRSTCVTTQFAGGQSESALPERASAVVQCRIIPGETQDQVTRTLTSLIADPAVTLDVAWPIAPSPESPPAPVWAMVTGVVHSMWPALPVMPVMELGASDAAYTRSAGIPTYGIDATFLELGDDRAHGRNERTSVAVFNDDLTFMYRLMRAASRRPE